MTAAVTVGHFHEKKNCDYSPQKTVTIFLVSSMTILSVDLFFNRTSIWNDAKSIFFFFFFAVLDYWLDAIFST